MFVDPAAIGRARFMIYPTGLNNVCARVCEISWLALAPTTWAKNLEKIGNLISRPRTEQWSRQTASGDLVVFLELVFA